MNDEELKEIAKKYHDLWLKNIFSRDLEDFIVDAMKEVLGSESKQESD